MSPRKARRNILMVHCRDDVKLSIVDGEPLLILGTAVKGWEIAISANDAEKFRAALDLYQRNP